MTLKIGLIGHSGKMGQILQELICQDPELILSGGANSTAQENDLLNLAEKSDVLIDFSHPNLLNSLLTAATKTKTALVIGTTGFSQEDKIEIQKAALEIPLLYSPNFSLGIALLNQLLKLTSEKAGSLITPSIRETHHKHKKDLPSGTALFLAEEIKALLNWQKPIPIEALRLDEAIGKHELFFELKDEKVTLTHEALSRKAFARGALLAAKFLYQKPSRLYKIEEIFTSLAP